MDSVSIYHNEVSTQLEKIATEQRENIEKGALLIAETVMAGKVFHVFGTGGHSNMVAVEMCHRAGNLIPANTILDPGLSCEHGATRWCEKITGYAQQVLRYYKVQEGDVMVQFNAYGINCVTIDCAEECRRLGVKIIGVTSPALSRSIPDSFPGRHPSKKNLCDLADVVIDNYTPYGEAVVPIGELPYKVSPTSSITNIFIMDALNARACEIMNEKGFKPPVWVSGNIPGGTEMNQAGMDKYFGTLRHL